MYTTNDEIYQYTEINYVNYKKVWKRCSELLAFSALNWLNHIFPVVKWIVLKNIKTTFLKLLLHDSEMSSPFTYTL